MEKAGELKPCGCGCTPRIRSYRTYHNHGFVEKYYIYCDGWETIDVSDYIANTQNT